MQGKGSMAQALKNKQNFIYKYASYAVPCLSSLKSLGPCLPSCLQWNFKRDYYSKSLSIVLCWHCQLDLNQYFWFRPLSIWFHFPLLKMYLQTLKSSKGNNGPKTRGTFRATGKTRKSTEWSKKQYQTIIYWSQLRRLMTHSIIMQLITVLVKLSFEKLPLHLLYTIFFLLY